MKAYREGAEWLAASPYEKHTITSYDGLRLAGYYLPAFPAAQEQAPQCILLCMHGYRSNAFKEYGIYGNFYHTDLRADLWIPDQRTHGESEGKYICYGVKERFDVQDWVAYINRISEKQYGKKLPIYLHGISMGCATVLMAYALGFPENDRRLRLYHAGCHIPPHRKTLVPPALLPHHKYFQPDLPGSRRIRFQRCLRARRSA